MKLLSFVWYLLLTLLLFAVLLGVSFYFSMWLYQARELGWAFPFADEGLRYTFRGSFKDTFLAVAAIASTFAAIAGLFFTFNWNARNDNRVRSTLTYQLLKEWRESAISDALKDYLKYFGDTKGEEREKLRADLFAHTRQKVPAAIPLPNPLGGTGVITSEEQILGLRYAIRDILNYLEVLAIAYDYGDVNAHLCKKYFKTPVCSLHQDLSPYIDAIQGERDSKSAYIEFRTLALRWEKRDWWARLLARLRRAGGSLLRFLRETLDKARERLAKWQKRTK